MLAAGGFMSVYHDSNMIAYGAFSAFVFTMSITLSQKMRALENEIKCMMQMFRLFVPEQVLDRIAKRGIDSIKLGSAEEGTASILFSDIRSFSTIAEELTPRDTLGYLNAFMQRMTPAIQRHNGFANQFVGDAIMAIFYTSTHSFDADPETLKKQKTVSIADFYQGVLYCRAMEWEKALAAFSRALKIYPRDPVVELYVERCILLQRQPPPPEWNGVTVLDGK